MTARDPLRTPNPHSEILLPASHSALRIPHSAFGYATKVQYPFHRLSGILHLVKQKRTAILGPVRHLRRGVRDVNNQQMVA
jgi:hypothetical protein